MAKQRRRLPARKHRDRSRDEDSILLRSAESLGRVIGTLQRQLEGATTRLSETADDVMDRLPIGKADGSASKAGAAATRHKRDRATPRRAAGASRDRKTGTRTTRKVSTAARTPKRAATTRVARKTKAARKATRRR